MSYGKGYDQLREQMKKQGATGGNLGGVYTKPYTPPKTYTQPAAAPQPNPYEAYLRRMEEAAESQRAAAERALQQQYDAGVKEIRGYEGDLLRQAEIQNRVSQNQLPQQAALMGSGGLSESSLMGLDAQLGESRNRISNEALSQIGGLRGKLQAGQAANTNAYYDKLMGIMQQEAQAELSRQNQLAQAARMAADQAQQNQMKQAKQNAYAQMLASGNPKNWLNQNAANLDYDTYDWLMGQYSAGSKAGLYETGDNAKVSSAFSSMISSGNPDAWLSSYSKNLTNKELNELLNMYRTYSNQFSFTDGGN